MPIFDELTATSTTAKYAVNTTRVESDGKCYLYVMTAATATSGIVNGTVLYDATTAGVVTDDVSDAKYGFNSVRGVSIGTVAVSTYCWIQTWGAHSAVKTNGDDDIAAGATLIGDTTDGVCDSVSAGTASTYKPIGYATADDVDSADTVAAFLTMEKASMEG
jgi:hypothetical protein